MPDYSVPANQCPLLKYRTAIHDPAIDAPFTFLDQALEDSDVQQLRVKFNQALVKIEEIASGGAGAWAVVAGVGGELKLSTATGLSAPVASGLAMIDGPVLPTDIAADGVNGQYNYAWANAGAVFDVLTSSNPAIPPAPPSDPGTYIGRFRCVGGNVTEVDHSGVLMIRGGILYRRTGDAGAPTDTPPASLIIVTQTAGGWWIWTGSAYVPIIDSANVLISNTDTSPAYLTTKILVTPDLGKTILNPGAAEQIQLDVSPHVETFTVDIDVVPGEDIDATVDFNLIGAYAGDYFIKVDSDQAEVNVVALANGRTTNTFRLYIESPTNAAAGSFGTATNLRLTVRLEGFNFTAGAGGAASITPAQFAFGAGYDSPTWVKKSFTFAALAAAALTNDIELLLLPAAGVVHAVKIKHSAAFVGGAISAYTLSVGILGNLTKYAAAFSVFGAPSGTSYELQFSPGGEDHGAAVSIRLAAVATGANLNQATAGAVDVWTLISIAA